ncbi:hypothetical protein BG003_009491 [Podila horticola]|nr:hypothetical protein BG003_009491 [Podila horticola]
MASPQYRPPYVQETHQNTVQSLPIYPTPSSPSPATSLAYPMPVSSSAQSYTSQQQTYPLLPVSSPIVSHSSQGYPVLPTSSSGFPSPASTYSHNYPPSTQAFNSGPHSPPQPYQSYQDDAPPYSPPEQHQYQLPGFSQAPPLSPRVQQNPYIPMAAPVQPPPARTSYVPPPSSSSHTSAIPTTTSTTAPTRRRRDSDPRQLVLPILPSLPARPAPTPSAKCCVLKPLPYGWSPTTPQGQIDPMEALSAPTNGYQNVQWNHAFPDLQCDGGCKNPFAFATQIRYTCVTCKNSAFDLCEACFGSFGQEGMGAIHNPNHELMKMDLAFPDWSHPAWHGGIEDLGKAVRQIGAKTLAWAKGDEERGKQCVLKMPFPEEVSKRPEVLEMDGMNLSGLGLIAILTVLEPNLTEITVRSGPHLGGLELAKVFSAFLEEMPNSFPRLHTIRAIGCNFFDFRSNEASKKVDYAKVIANQFAKARARQQKLFEAWIQDRTEIIASSGGGGFCGLFGSSSKSSGKNKKPKPYVRPVCKVQFSICDGRMSGPCGFPGLQPAFWTTREPVLCYNVIRDLTLGMVEYLGDPDRMLDPVAERVRILNKRKAARYARFVKMLGGAERMTEEANLFLNAFLDGSVSQY